MGLMDEIKGFLEGDKAKDAEDKAADAVADVKDSATEAGDKAEAQIRVRRGWTAGQHAYYAVVQKWEYAYLESHGSLLEIGTPPGAPRPDVASASSSLDALQAMGSLGWELVSESALMVSPRYVIRNWTFKRPA